MKELSTETRLILAILLSMAVVAIWQVLFPPPPPKRPAAQQAAAPQAPEKAPAPPAAVSAVPPRAPARREATEEKTIVVESELYRVEFTNRGGVVRSWQLKKYTDDHKPPRTLDVVHPETAEKLGGWPLGIALDDAALEARVNAALFDVTPAAGSIHAPANVSFEWSDGQFHVTKKLQFGKDYIVEIESAVTLDGKPLAHAIAWRGGFGDTTVYLPYEHVQVFFRANGKLQQLAHKKLGTPDHPDVRLRQIGTMEYAGIEDRYFAAAFLPRGSGLALWHWRLEAEQLEEQKPVKIPVAEMSAGTTVAGPVGLRLFVGPKDLDLLGKLTPPMTELVDFGWFGFIAAPLFYFLKWIYGFIPNYGWAIILMTVVINMLLFPLKVTSWRSMQKMQKVAPEIKAIQERYKKYALRDPRKQQMNEEVMAVYKREGVNPMGGCLPMLLQMPIWIALYQMLNVTIELRHAPWHGWIRDLSSHDPYYIMPVLMTLTMYLMQKMTPVTTTDPAQQRMMTLMPFFFGVLFFRVQSGLVLYILASNLIGIAQQWYLNRTSPVNAKAPSGKKK